MSEEGVMSFRCAAEHPDDNRLRVLLVDDSPVSSGRILSVLSSAFAVTDVKTVSGKAGFHLAMETFTADIVIFNIALMGGGTFDCGDIHEEAMRIPFVIVTDEKDEDRAMDMLSCGASDYVLNGKLLKIIPVVRRLLDERKKRNRLLSALKDVKRSKMQYLSLSEKLNVITFRSTVDGRLLQVNLPFVRMSGYELEEIIDLPLEDLYQIPEERRLFISEVVKNGHIEKMIVHFKRKDGTILIASMRATALRDKTTENIIIDGVVEDITERVETENRLYHVNRELELLFNSMSNIIIGVSRGDIITHWNKEAEVLFGVLKEKMIGRGFINCGIQWDWDDIYVGIAESLADRKLVTLRNLNYTRADGINGSLSLTINPMRNEQDGEIQGFLILAIDYTERRHLEEQLLQVRKLEAVGQLAAGISHEINSPMQYICDNIGFVKRKFTLLSSVCEKYRALAEKAQHAGSLAAFAGEIIEEEQEKNIPNIIREIPEALNDAEDGTNRIKKIVTAMKKFSHPGTGEKKPTDINNVITTTVTISRNEWKYVADFIPELGENLPEIPCIESELSQVMLNLIINARDAITDAIETGSIQRGIIRVATRRLDDMVEISVSDNALGIPEPIRSKIFDPFFTTKEVGRGSGQGLAISHTIIVNDLGGSITFDSEEGNGTTFFLRLPVMAI